MKRTAICVLLALAGAGRLAAAAPIVRAPTGWTGGASASLVTQTGAVPHFGGVHGVIEGEQYTAPKPGIVLYATRVSANSAAREAAARAEIDALKPASPTAWNEHYDAAARQFDVTASWRDASAHVVEQARLVIAAAGDSVIVAVKGECLAADDAEPAEVDACKAALATLDLGIEVKNRVELSATTSLPATPPPTPAPTPPSMGDGSRVPIPPIVIHTDEPSRDLRSVYVGFGVVMLAAVFWWNRRRRERFEREETSDER